jgi:hypothetical protein
MSSFIFEFKFITVGRGVGPGLSPDPRSFYYTYDHTIYGIARQLVGAEIIIHSPWFYVIYHIPMNRSWGELVWLARL